MGGGEQSEGSHFKFLLLGIPLKESFSVDPRFDRFFSTKQIYYIITYFPTFINERPVSDS